MFATSRSFVVVTCHSGMVLDALAYLTQSTATELADATLQRLRRVVPAAVRGILFLSGGQSGHEASTSLYAIHVGHELPWTLSFSFARALQYLTLDIWAGKDRNRVTAQQPLEHLARCNCAALTGNYNALLETQ